MFSFAKKLVDKLEGVNGHEPDTYFRNTLSRNNGYGLRVLHVEQNSTAANLGLEAWFDYIVGFAGHDLPIPSIGQHTHSYLINDDGSFMYGAIPIAEQARMVDFDMIAHELDSIARSPNHHVEFEVWNAKGGILRTVSVPLQLLSSQEQPQKLSEHQALTLHTSFSRLGLTVQSQHLNSATFVWKVMNSHRDSPAFRALLIPHADFIIGCDSAFPTDTPSTGLLASGGENLLRLTIAKYYKVHLETLQEDRIPIVLYVYNHDYDIVRPVTVHLTSSWCPEGNKGILGCDIGYGLLHRLPVVIGKFDSSMHRLTDDMYHNSEDVTYQVKHQINQPHIVPSNSNVVSQTVSETPGPEVTNKEPNFGTSTTQNKLLSEDDITNQVVEDTTATGALETEPHLEQSLHKTDLQTLSSHEQDPHELKETPIADLPKQIEEPSLNQSSPIDAPVEEEQNEDDFFASLGEAEIKAPLTDSNLATKLPSTAEHKNVVETANQPQVAEEFQEILLDEPEPMAPQEREAEFNKDAAIAEHKTEAADIILDDPIDDFLDDSIEQVPDTPDSLPMNSDLKPEHADVVQHSPYEEVNLEEDDEPSSQSFREHLQRNNNEAISHWVLTSSHELTPDPYEEPATKSYIAPPPKPNLPVSTPPPVALPLNSIQTTESAVPPPPKIPTSSGGPPPVSGTPQKGARRKRHAPLSNLNALADIMNDELSKSQKSDYMLVPSTLDPNLPPPPRPRP